MMLPENRYKIKSVFHSGEVIVKSQNLVGENENLGRILLEWLKRMQLNDAPT